MMLSLRTSTAITDPPSLAIPVAGTLHPRAREHARHFDGEARTASEMRIEGDRASQEIRKASHDGQTQPRPAGAPRIGIASLTERLEDTRGVALSDTDPRIAHGYPDAV